jgi:hypothetical protein
MRILAAGLTAGAARGVRSVTPDQALSCYMALGQVRAATSIRPSNRGALKMDTIIFLPGYAGSQLTLYGNEVWPPTVPELAGLGYHRLNELTDPNAQKNGVIDAITYLFFSFSVYQPIDDDLSYIAAQLGITKIDFDFDWRVDIYTKTMPLLAQTIQAAYNAGARSISLVCHSQGGIVARLLLESDAYRTNPPPPWFSAIKQFVGICNPHLGAPLIVANSLGVFGYQGIAASDMPALAADPRYPAGYQALPPPGYNRLRKQPGNHGVNIYATTVNGYFGPNSNNIQATVQSYANLNIANQPATCQYYLLAGNNQSTPEQVDAPNSLLPPYTPDYDDSGDGTIPLWSAAPGPMTASVFPGSHTGIFAVDAFRQRLFQILTGGTVTPMPFAEKPVAVISLNKLVYGPGELISVLVIPDKPTHAFTGALRISRAVGDKFDKLEPIGPDIEIRYAGAETTHLSMQLVAPDKSGAYRITLEESEYVTTPVTEGTFFVNPEAGPRLNRK